MTEGAGGSVFVPNKINDEGAVVAGLVVPGDANGFEAGVWKDGVVTHLGALPGDCYSYAWSFGPKGQIGGNSASCDLPVTRAVLWEDGSIVDLNALIPAGSNLKLVTVFEINDRGEISGSGLPAGVPPVPNEDTTRAFLLIPCDEGHPDVAGCDYSLVQGSTATAPATARAAQTPVAVRMR